MTYLKTFLLFGILIIGLFSCQPTSTGDSSNEGEGLGGIEVSSTTPTVNMYYMDHPDSILLQLDDFKNSGFNLLTMCFMAVDENGNLSFNMFDHKHDNFGIPLIVKDGKGTDVFSQELIDSLHSLKNKFGFKLYFSMGGWAASPYVYNSLDSIFTIKGGQETIQQKSAKENLNKNLKWLINKLHIDGVDLDIENRPGYVVNDNGDTVYVDYPYWGADFSEVIASFTGFLHNAGLEVTYCPYSSNSLWMDCLKKVHQTHGKQLVKGLNLQTYSQATVNGFITSIENNSASVGISEAAAFLTAGFWPNKPDYSKAKKFPNAPYPVPATTAQYYLDCRTNLKECCGVSGSYCPSKIESIFKSFASNSNTASINGGYFWQYNFIRICKEVNCTPDTAKTNKEVLQAYSKAIIGGLKSK